MDIDEVIAKAKQTTDDQIAAAKKSLDNQLDTADRITMLRAVDATIRLAQQPITANPQ